MATVVGNSIDKDRAYNAIRTDYSTSGPFGSIRHELYIPTSLHEVVLCW